MNATNEAKRKTPEDGAAYAAQMIREALMMLTEHDGLTWDEALAGAHAEVVTAMVLGYGGQTAAERCASAALRVAHLPSADEGRGLLGRPAGHA